MDATVSPEVAGRQLVAGNPGTTLPGRGCHEWRDMGVGPHTPRWQLLSSAHENYLQLVATLGCRI